MTEGTKNIVITDKSGLEEGRLKDEQEKNTHTQSRTMNRFVLLQLISWFAQKP